MKEIQIIICENFYPEYKAVLEDENLDGFRLCVFPSVCDQKGLKNAAREILKKVNHHNNILICSKSCDALKLLPRESKIREMRGNYCFSHLTSDEFLNYLVSEGSYIVSIGWLRHWKRHITSMGFTEENAKKFFQESCKQLVFIDFRNNDDDKEYLKKFASYVGLPYLIITIELKELTLMLKTIAYKWQLKKQKEEYKSEINNLRNQSAEYSTIFDLLNKISTYSSRRNIIGQIEKLFLMIFGAQKFVFWSNQSVSLPEEIKELQKSEKEYLLLRESNRFFIKITWGNILYGIIDVSGFLFPKYIDKYLNLAMEVSKISGLVFHNNAQYEKILTSEEKLKYMSFHDSMTGLYNRNYINERASEIIHDRNICVFMFDIDKLKYVNDHFGHVEGDKLIKRFSRILEKSFRETDVVARIGGDEFVAFFHDSDEGSAETIKERITNLIRINNESVKVQGLELSVSMGYARTEEGYNTIEDLIRKADALMYEDKNKKK